MHVRNFIAERGQDWLHDLVVNYKITAAVDGDLVSLKYNQLESPMHEPIVQECRGMVVEVATGRILCHPYNKFWNAGEPLAASVDWSTARVQDKLDGSLALLYERDGEWLWASSGSPLGGGSYNGNGITFGDKFRQVFEETGMQTPEPESADVGFFFELVAPDNRIVCKYDEPRLVLHGARYRHTGREVSRACLESVARLMNWPIVGEHPLRTPEEVDAAVHALDPVKGEGFIVVDDQFRRLKIKSPRYVALHKLRDRTTPSAVIDLWKQGEVEELLAYFPEHAESVLGMVGKLETACEEAYAAYSANRSAISRKAYADAVKGKVWSSIAFKLLDNDAAEVEDARRILRASFDTLAHKILEAS